MNDKPPHDPPSASSGSWTQCWGERTGVDRVVNRQGWQDLEYAPSTSGQGGKPAVEAHHQQRKFGVRSLELGIGLDDVPQLALIQTEGLFDEDVLSRTERLLNQAGMRAVAGQDDGQIHPG